MIQRSRISPNGGERSGVTSCLRISVPLATLFGRGNTVNISLSRIPVSPAFAVEVYEDSFAAAYESLLGIVADLRDQANEDGRPFPAPSYNHVNSGSDLVLHLPDVLRQRLAVQAAQRGVPLGAYLLAMLDESSARQAYLAAESSAEDTQPPRATGPEE